MSTKNVLNGEELNRLAEMQVYVIDTVERAKTTLDCIKARVVNEAGVESGDIETINALVNLTNALSVWNKKIKILYNGER